MTPRSKILTSVPLETRVFTFVRIPVHFRENTHSESTSW